MTNQYQFYFINIKEILSNLFSPALSFSRCYYTDVITKDIYFVKTIFKYIPMPEKHFFRHLDILRHLFDDVVLYLCSVSSCYVKFIILNKTFENKSSQQLSVDDIVTFSLSLKLGIFSVRYNLTYLLKTQILIGN